MRSASAGFFALALVAYNGARSPGIRSAAVLERRRGQEVDHRLRRARHARRAARTSCRRPSASPSSTTTARCGASSRCISRSPSRSTASRRWRRSIRNGKTKQPFKAVLDRRHEGAGRAGREGRCCRSSRRRTRGMTTEEFAQDRRATGSRPRGIRASTGPTPSCVYQPMLELLAYLRANGFKTFIVSGGGVEFMRPWTEKRLRHPARAGGRLVAASSSSRSDATASRC